MSESKLVCMWPLALPSPPAGLSRPGVLFMQDGETALIWAAWHGHTEVVEVLLNAKANVDATNKVWCAGVLGWGAVWSPS